MDTASRAQIADTIHGGEYWLRCPYCGDSENDPNKAHFSINLRSGLYFCLRCNARGKLNKKAQFELFGRLPVDLSEEAINKVDTEDQFREILDRLEEGAPWSRPSLLPRYTYTDDYGQVWDAFISYDNHDGAEIGVLLRLADTQQKKAYFYGSRGFSWVGDSFPSSANKPIRLVEGPYDVITPQDVVVFGLLSKYTVSEFTGENIILCPDGDVWQKENLRKPFFTLLRYLLYQSYAVPWLVGVEYIPEGADPDECPPDQRLFITRQEVATKLLRR